MKVAWFVGTALLLSASNAAADFASGDLLVTVGKSTVRRFTLGGGPCPPAACSAGPVFSYDGACDYFDLGAVAPEPAQNWGLCSLGPLNVGVANKAANNFSVLGAGGTYTREIHATSVISCAAGLVKVFAASTDDLFEFYPWPSVTVATLFGLGVTTSGWVDVEASGCSLLTTAGDRVLRIDACGSVSVSPFAVSICPTCSLANVRIAPSGPTLGDIYAIDQAGSRVVRFPPLDGSLPDAHYDIGAGSLTGLTFDVDGSGFWVAEIAPPGRIHHINLSLGAEDGCIQALCLGDSSDRVVGDARVFQDIGIGDSLAAESAVPALGGHRVLAIGLFAFSLFAVALATLKRRARRS
jgi:hypothetical protein